MKRKFSWDGDNIKESKFVDELKHSPKDILDALADVRNKINQMIDGSFQLKQQLKVNENNLVSARGFEKELKEFEAKCQELQLSTLKKRVDLIAEECKKKGQEQADETISKDPDAYTEEQRKQLPYLNFQKLLATDEKVSSKVSAQLIKRYLYEEPVFDNPFK